MKWKRTVTVVGCHVGGEANDVIVGGVLPPPGATMFVRLRFAPRPYRVERLHQPAQVARVTLPLTA